VAFWFGAGAAAFLSAYSLIVVDSYRPTVATAGWWLLRLGIDGLPGGLAALSTPGGATFGLDPHVQWILSGAFAPLLLRQIHFGDPTSGKVSIDFRDYYDRLRLPLDERLDSASATADSLSDDRLARRIKERGGTPSGLAVRVLATIRTSRALQTRAADADYVRDIANGEEDEYTRLLVIIAKARELRLIRVVRRYARSPGDQPTISVDSSGTDDRAIHERI